MCRSVWSIRVLVVLVGLLTSVRPVWGREASARAWGELEGDIGVGFMGSDVFTTLQTGFDLQEGAFSMGLQLRLRLRVADRGDEREGQGVRREDWDEPSDLAHILRYVSYRRKISTVELGLQLGEHSGYTLGNGTLLRSYASAVDVDHPHSGVALRASGKAWQVDLFLDDAVAPEVTAARVLLRPVRGRHNLLIGTSGLLDFRAPLEASLSDDGLRQVDKRRNLRVSRALLGGVGLDVGYQLGRSEADHVAVYVDGNLLIPEKSAGGPAMGLHVGARFAVRPFRGRLRFFGGLEYRRLGQGYIPSYVDLQYDVQRLQFPLTDRAVDALGGTAPTKLGAITAGLAPAGNAYWGQLGMGFGDWLELSAHYEHRPGLMGKGLGARASVVIGKRFLATALVERFGVVAADDLGSASGLLASVEARYRPTKGLYVLAQYSRLWQLRQSGYYRPLDQLNVACGYAWGY